MINVEINGKLVGQCESAGKASSPLFKDVIDPWIEIRGFTASSPSLTDDQHVVLEWLKWVSEDNGEDAMDCIYRLVYGEAETSVSLAFIELDNKQQFQVLAAFAEWGSKEDNQ